MSLDRNHGSVCETETSARSALEENAGHLSLRGGIEEERDAGRDAGGEVDVHDSALSADDRAVIDPVIDDCVGGVTRVGNHRRVVGSAVSRAQSTALSY